MIGSFSEQFCENAEVVAESLLIVQVVDGPGLACQAVADGNVVDTCFTPKS